MSSSTFPISWSDQLTSQAGRISRPKKRKRPDDLEEGPYQFAYGSSTDQMAYCSQLDDSAESRAKRNRKRESVSFMRKDPTPLPYDVHFDPSQGTLQPEIAVLDIGKDYQYLSQHYETKKIEASRRSKRTAQAWVPEPKRPPVQLMWALSDPNSTSTEGITRTCALDLCPSYPLRPSAELAQSDGQAPIVLGSHHDPSYKELLLQNEVPSSPPTGFKRPEEELFHSPESPNASGQASASSRQLETRHLAPEYGWRRFVLSPVDELEVQNTIDRSRLAQTLDCVADSVSGEIYPDQSISCQLHEESLAVYQSMHSLLDTHRLPSWEEVLEMSIQERNAHSSWCNVF
ncbi:hypothetical protein SISNIDRAFT_487587 [Sistotremastrum niveocremeum HHB9708]|uniref:Uncharacterized protein n=1 Tax=Sistotremastrum niveocremeum HHB9708 TaxID=1314777 RepID=A0A164S9B6_9AGAM|nr:hypothetical protein SISNIDRAFT_487587 [Sistotremastrum niveocremeum HHB9708]